MEEEEQEETAPATAETIPIATAPGTREISSDPVAAVPWIRIERVSEIPATERAGTQGSLNTIRGSPNEEGMDVIPNTNDETPREKIETPRERAETPREKVGTPSEKVGTPNEKVGTPSEIAEIRIDRGITNKKVQIIS